MANRDIVDVYVFGSHRRCRGANRIVDHPHSLIDPYLIGASDALAAQDWNFEPSTRGNEPSRIADDSHAGTRRLLQTLDAIISYLPVGCFNGVAGLGFIAGYVTLGIAVATSEGFSRWSGLLIAVGAPAHLVGFGAAQLAAPALWFVAVLGSLALGVGLAWCGYRLWAEPQPPPPGQPR